ncbi:MAG: M28 family peptidase [Bacteroidetes bacterium]|nr:M28 family peptidase [Bacteroidota bacterium]
MKKCTKLFIIILLFVLVSSCNSQTSSVQEAENVINDKNLEKHIVALSSDEFLGRQPFTEGEVKTTEYLKSEFEKMGLKGANNGSFFQEVPMVEITFNPTKKLKLNAPLGVVEFNLIEDFILSTSHVKEEIVIENSEMVFAGYGIVAPEFNWNDYAGLDVKGKTVLVLVNDPGFETQDAELFNGNAMTYYGRWTYKFEEAARQGAAGVLVIHNTAGAGYPWEVLTNTADNKLFIQSEDGNASNCEINGWVTDKAAKRLFKKCGLDFKQMKEEALSGEFKAIPLKTDLNLRIDNQLRFASSKNVMAIIEGADLEDECIIYSAHWDHFGIGPVINGDSIYNGAADNGIPIACMLETANAFAALKEAPRRSVIFLAVTAEETGLLGSQYYVENPIFPIQKTIANLNYELFLPIGRMKDVTITGYGQSDLDKYVAEAAAEQDRYTMPEPFPENGMYYRSDHFSFARKGVPSLFVKGWSDHREKGKDFAAQKVNEYWKTTYHKPSDEFDPQTADLSGNIEDAKLFFKIGIKLAMVNSFPQWAKTSEFRAIREKSFR